MKTSLFFSLLFLFKISFSQTGIYSSDGILTVETPTSVDVLLGYPNANDLDSNAISEYNKGTEIIFGLNKFIKEEHNKQLKIAIDHLIKSINYDDSFVQAYDNLGKAYRMLGEIDIAIEVYKISVKIFPGGVSAIQNLAIAYSEKKEWSSSILEYKKLIKIAPNNPEGYYGLAGIYKKTAQLDIALKNALKALKLYEYNPPNFIGDSYGRVGLIYYYMGDKENARKYIIKAKEKDYENNFEERFKATYTKSLLNELQIQ
jgi:lipopolysaccharide biosynthesis regulator YciM